MNTEQLFIVEDNAFSLQFFRETLHSRSPSMDILQATDEREAFQKINTLLPDVIFIDLGLPMEDRTASQ